MALALLAGLASQVAAQDPAAEQQPEETEGAFLVYLIVIASYYAVYRVYKHWMKAPPPEPPSVQRFCHMCGEGLTTGAQFCTGCGTRAGGIMAGGAPR